jgi:anti-sigma regulatory factor (Ser/Thr protein kinase)
MSLPAQLEFEVPSDPKHLPPLRARLRSWLEGHHWSEQQVGEIVLALDEAVTNVIRHGYLCQKEHRIIICARMIDDPGEGDGVEIRVRDFGKQVDPAEICGRDLDDVRPGGLGVHIIHAMNSSVSYQRAEGGGMLLTMRKFRTHTADCGRRPAERP